MEWGSVISYLLSNELRLFLGLFFVAKLTQAFPYRRALFFPFLSGCLVTVLQVTTQATVSMIAAEVAILAILVWYYLREPWNRCLFLSFFYEIGAGLWDYLIPAGLGILFHSEHFLETGRPEHQLGIWLVRLLMTGAAVLLSRQHRQQGHKSPDVISFVSKPAILGLLGAVTLSAQTILPLDEELTGTWALLSMVLLFDLLFYRISRQREVERELAQLKQEQAEILERDYQNLSRTYADNARLYHDLHHHIDAIYQYLTQGDLPTAVQYCEGLRIPAQETSQAVWTGDTALDYLISSKLTLAAQARIRTRVNIEYPHNANIQSMDLTAILGNLLDNACEAATTAPESLRFLNLTIRRINAMLIIKVENGYLEAPVQKNGKLLTSKADPSSHGWGLKSVLTAAERYDGTLRTEYADGIFRAVVTLSFRPGSIEEAKYV